MFLPRKQLMSETSWKSQNSSYHTRGQSWCLCTPSGLMLSLPPVYLDCYWISEFKVSWSFFFLTKIFITLLFICFICVTYVFIRELMPWMQEAEDGLQESVLSFYCRSWGTGLRSLGLEASHLVIQVHMDGPWFTPLGRRGMRSSAMQNTVPERPRSTHDWRADSWLQAVYITFL